MYKTVYLEIRADVSTWVKVSGYETDFNFDILKQICLASSVASDWRGYPFIKYYDTNDEHYADAEQAYNEQEAKRLEEKERVKF